MNAVDCVIALDTADREQALAWVDLLAPIRPKTTVFKVGLELFTAHGPEFVRQLRSRGARVFLDLKLHDIPNTVAKSVRAARELGVEFLTLHAAGGRSMWAAAGAESGAVKLLAVTVLTSFDDQAWQEAALTEQTIADTVTAWAAASQRWGASGWVCSSHELAMLPSGGYRMVPGIRMAGGATQDQARVATPREAAIAGASGIVLGRAVLAAPDPAQALQNVFKELDSRK